MSRRRCSAPTGGGGSAGEEDRSDRVVSRGPSSPRWPGVSAEVWAPAGVPSSMRGSEWTRVGSVPQNEARACRPR